MTVYVTQDIVVRGADGEMKQRFDISQAEEYGPLKVLLSGSQSVSSTVPVVRQVLEQLRGFNDEDYVLMLGDPALMAVAAMIASKYNDGRMKLLKWDRRHGKYFPVQIDISGKTL